MGRVAAVLKMEDFEVLLPVPTIISAVDAFLRLIFIPFLGKDGEEVGPHESDVAGIGEAVLANRDQGEEEAAGLEEIVIRAHLIKPALPIALLTPMFKRVISMNFIKHAILVKDEFFWKTVIHIPAVCGIASWVHVN